MSINSDISEYKEATCLSFTKWDLFLINFYDIDIKPIFHVDQSSFKEDEVLKEVKWPVGIQILFPGILKILTD